MMLFVGIADAASKAMISGCLLWASVGSILLACPFAIVLYGFLTIRNLKKEDMLVFMKNPSRTFKEFWSDLKSHHGLRHKMSFAIIAISEARFVGQWAKKTPSAKFWGFFLSNTGPFWFAFTFVLVKKLCTPLILNWTEGGINAVAIAAIFWIDGAAFFLLKGHRDHMINWGGVFTALGNGLAASLTAIQIILPADLVPVWINGRLVMFCMLGATAVTGLQAMIDPVSQAAGILKKFNLFTCLPALIAPIYPAMKASIPFLYAKFKRILQGRVTKKAKADIVGENMEAQGVQANAIVFRSCVVCDQQFQDDEGLLCCGAASFDKDNAADVLIDYDDHESEAKPPHFTCSACLTGHLLLTIEAGGLWDKNHCIFCPLFPHSCNDPNGLPHRRIKTCLWNAGELEVLKDYMAVWNVIFGTEERLRRRKNIHGGRTSPVLVEIDAIVDDIETQLEFGRGHFETVYPDWIDDVNEAERYYVQDDDNRALAHIETMRTKYHKAKEPNVKLKGKARLSAFFNSKVTPTTKRTRSIRKSGVTDENLWQDLRLSTSGDLTPEAEVAVHVQEDEVALEREIERLLDSNGDGLGTADSRGV